MDEFIKYLVDLEVNIINLTNLTHKPLNITLILYY